MAFSSRREGALGNVATAAKFIAECRAVKDLHFDNTLLVPSELVDKYKESLGSEVNTLWERYNHYKFHLYNLIKSSSESPENMIQERLKKKGLPFLGDYVSEWASRRLAEEQVFYYRYAQLPTKVVLQEWYRPDDQCGDWCAARKAYMLSLQCKALEDWRNSLNKMWTRIGTGHTVTAEDDWIRSTIIRHIVESMSDRINALRYKVKHSEFPLSRLVGNELTKRFELVATDVKNCIECLGRTHIDGHKPEELEELVVGERPEEDRMEELYFLRETEIPAGFISDASVSLLRVLHSTGFDQTAVIAKFLAQLKKAFPCEVCDYLSVEDSGARIEWRAATIEKKHMSNELQSLNPEEQRRRINVHEGYDKGVGISGSILLQDFSERTVWFHIGSSDVQYDPRGSSQHRSAYESGLYVGVLKATEKIENFWMFPVFGKFGKLIGAFRVVNRLDVTEGDNPPRLRPGGWAYLEKVQLSLIAAWFSRFLAAIQERVYLREDYLKIMDMEKGLADLLVHVGSIGLAWTIRTNEDGDKNEANEDVLDMMLRLLRFLTKLTARKVENRQMGCTVFVDAPTAKNPPIKGIPPYPLVEVSDQEPSVHGWESLPKLTAHEDLAWLQDYCDAVDPMYGAFVFDQKGDFSRIALYATANQTGEEAAKTITKKHKQSICLLLERGMKSVLVIAVGARRAEIRLAEKSGEWRFRRSGGLVESLKANYPGEISDTILKAVAETAMVLSRRGEGGILVVGSYPEDKIRLADSQLEPPVTMITDVAPHLLADCARLDGATFINEDGSLQAYNRNVRFKEDPGLTPLFPGLGARHETAERIARCAPQALVTVVSQNGGISVIKQGGMEVADVL